MHTAINIDEILNAWAKWRVSGGDIGAPAGYGKTFIARMMSFLRSLKCRVCHGHGSVRRADYARSKRYKKCDKCKGKGRINMAGNSHKINPACIHGTGLYIDTSADDTLNERVDRIIAGMDYIEIHIVIVEYSKPGSQRYKAAKMGLSTRTYERKLAAIKSLIVDKLTEMAELC